jgi:hypothetical protein
MKKIPWFFVYSEKYSVFYDIFTSIIGDIDLSNYINELLNELNPEEYNEFHYLINIYNTISSS